MIKKDKADFIESIKSYDMFNQIYSGIYDKDYIKLVLYEYPYIFPDMIKQKSEMLKLIDYDIISIIC